MAHEPRAPGHPASEITPKHRGSADEVRPAVIEAIQELQKEKQRSAAREIVNLSMHHIGSHGADATSFVLEMAKRYFLEVARLPPLIGRADFIHRIPAAGGNKPTDTRVALLADHLGCA